MTGRRRGDLAAEPASARRMPEASGVASGGGLPGGFGMTEAIEAPVARLLREARTPIHHHACATRTDEDHMLQMRIGDNGRGGRAAHGNDVSGMRAPGGTPPVDSPPRHGTVLSIRVPLHAAAGPAERCVASLPAVGGAA